MFGFKRQEINPEIVLKLRKMMDKFTSKTYIDGEKKEEWVSVNLDEQSGKIVLTLGYLEQEKENIKLTREQADKLTNEIKKRLDKPVSLFGGEE